MNEEQFVDHSQSPQENVIQLKDMHYEEWSDTEGEAERQGLLNDFR